MKFPHFLEQWFEVGTEYVDEAARAAHDELLLTEHFIEKDIETVINDAIQALAAALQTKFANDAAALAQAQSDRDAAKQAAEAANAQVTDLQGQLSTAQSQLSDAENQINALVAQINPPAPAA